MWGSAAAGANDAANAVLQLPGGGDLVVAGYRAVGGVNQRSLTKLALSSGVEIWTATWPSASQQMHGAWEMAQLTTDGTAVLLAGLHDSDDKDEFNFKSYGNVVAGTAIVQKLPTSALLGSSPPAASAAAWTYTSSEYFTSKAARPLSDGSMVVLLYSEVQAATLVKLDSAGSVLWGPTDFGALHGEGTDIAISTDGQSILIAGQGDGGISGTLSGRLTQVSLSGAHLWSKSYTSTPYDGTAGASAKLIKNECWGMQALADGYVVGCGTGIEDCNGLSGQLAADCAAGTADARAGAYPRQASVWQSMIFLTDLNGNLQWLRTDQLKESDDPPLGQTGWVARSSASECVLATADGGIFSINDEVGGIGLLRLTAASSPPSPSPPPPSPPPPWLPPSPSPPPPSPPPSPPSPPPPSPPPPAPPPPTPPPPRHHRPQCRHQARLRRRDLRSAAAASSTAASSLTTPSSTPSTPSAPPPPPPPLAPCIGQGVSFDFEFAFFTTTLAATDRTRRQRTRPSVRERRPCICARRELPATLTSS